MTMKAYSLGYHMILIANKNTYFISHQFENKNNSAKWSLIVDGIFYEQIEIPSHSRKIIVSNISFYFIGLQNGFGTFY